MSSSAAFGAKGIGSFEKGVKYGYLPSESSIQHEGLIYDYYWETADEKEKLFKASYGAAVSRDPFSNSLEYYIGVGLASSLDGDGLYKHGGRPPLNIVIVLDISGSMGARFSGAEETLDKLTVAKNSILALMTHLNEKDRFGFITFDDKADVIHKLDNFSSIDQASFKEKLMKIETRGGTDVGKGLECAFSLYKDVPVNDKNKNRIIFLTDATPTTGDHDGTSMLKLCKQESERGIFTTFIGVGVDFNTNLVSMLSNIRGTNYFSVNSSKEFKKQMDLEFDYMVTVAIFNISIDFESPHWVAERVYGSPGYETPTQGRLLYIDSSFPTPKEGSNMTKGGIVIVKLKKTDNDKTGPLHFKVSYEDASGNKFNDKDEFVFPVKEGEEFYSNPSMRKAVLLMRYVNFLKYFLSDYRRKENLPANTSFTPSISFESGIKVYPVNENNEAHGSITMKEMDPEYKKMFEKFVSYFETEMEKIGDSTLDKELKNLNNIRSKGEKN